MALMTCIGGELTIYKLTRIEQTKVIESSNLTDDETKRLFDITVGKQQC
jgi:hypothetical protein